MGNGRNTTPAGGPRAWIVGVAVAAATFGLHEIYLERTAETRIAEGRSDALARLAAAGTALEGQVQAARALADGLATQIALNPGITADRFTRLAGRMAAARETVKALALIKGGVIVAEHPVAPNRAALGYDVRNHPGQAAIVQAARESGETVLAGPLSLIQGGRGFILRRPVRVPRADGDAGRHWGIVNVILEQDALISAAGLDESGNGLAMAARGRDASGPEGAVFHGDPTLFRKDPVRLTLAVPGGTWQLAARPEGGWEKSIGERWPARLAAALFALLAGGFGFGLVRHMAAERALRAAVEADEQRLRGILDHAPVPMAIADPQEDRLLYLNDAAHALLTPGGTEVPCDLASFHEDPARQHLPGMAAGSATPQTVELRLRDDQGRGFWAQVTARRLVYMSREATLLALADVTERREAEALREETEGLFRLLAETAPVPTVMSRLSDGTVITHNEQARRLLEVDAEDGAGRRCIDFYIEPGRRAALVEASLRQGSVRDFEAALRTAGGRPFWALISAATAIYRGEPVLLAGIMDITARKRTEEENRRYRRFVEQITEVLYTVRPDGRFGYLSPSWTRTGHDAEAAVGQPAGGFLHPDDREAHADLVATALTGSRPEPVEVRLLHADGRAHWYAVSASLLSGEEGETPAVLAVATDVDGRRRMEEDLLAAKEGAEATARELERSNAELEQFAYVTSHDLREPLRMITSYLTLLERHYGAQMDNEAREFMGFAVDGARRMDRIVLDLLEYSRVGRKETAVEAVSLDRVLEAALANLRLAREEAGAELLRPDSLPEVDGAPGELTRLFQNLIGNALKYRAPDRPARVSIGCTAEGRCWHLWVADEGIGIDPRYHERVFGLFQRLHGRQEYDGTGIGLAVVRKVVERHGGRIWLDSTPGAGTTVHFTLPARGGPG